ncbi:MAG TPA: hypothetical protein VJV78_37940 [Polyangiales bacterium]|nr:hypothetical protein [Polyangiales bacterium]
MATNPLQTLHIPKVEPHDLRQRKVLDLGFASRRLIYGPRIKPRIETQDEHDDGELSWHSGDVLGALRLSGGSGEATRFVTVGDDNRILIWNVLGKVEIALSGHDARVGGLWELTEDRLVSWGEDKTLVVWSTRTEVPFARMRAAIRTADRLLVGESGDFFCLSQFLRGRTISINGRPIATMWWQFHPVTAVRRLSGSRWITQSKSGLRLWSRGGRLQCKFPQPFSLDDGFFDLPDGQVLIVDDRHGLELIDGGAQMGARAPDEDMSGDLRRFLRIRKRVRAAIVDRKSVQDFEHRNSPVCEGQVLQPTQRKELGTTFADFFNRPDFKRIRSWRRGEIRVALEALERVEQALHDHRSRGSTAGTLRSLALAAFSAAFISAFWATEREAIYVVVVTALVSGAFAVWKHIEAQTQHAAARALASVPAEVHALVSEIKLHRRRILAGAPHIASPAVYTGYEVRRQIERTIATQLSEQALLECRLQASALRTANKSSLILRDWALLRGDRSPRKDGLSARNLGSFWWSPAGDFMPAVQSIQYVLLTRERLDVFTVDYDFITGRAHNATAHACYYSEIASVTKRQSTRHLSLPGLSTLVDAQELLLVLTSGKQISLTFLDEECDAALRSAVRAKTAASLTEQRRNLEAELERWQHDMEHSDRERTDELESLRAQLASLQSESVPDARPQRPHLTRGHADEVLTIIRNQILAHTEALTPRLLVEDKLFQYPQA